jgi:hypothetical protein
MGAAIEETFDDDPPNPIPNLPMRGKPPSKLTVAVDSLGPFGNPFNPNQIRNPYNANKFHANEIATPRQFDCSVEASKPTLSLQDKNVICPETWNYGGFQVTR